MNLHHPARHEPLQPVTWDPEVARNAILHIVHDTEARFSPDHYWPPHVEDVREGEDAEQRLTPLYHGAGGVIWALHHLQDLGAVQLAAHYGRHLDGLLLGNRAWLQAASIGDYTSYMMGDLPILMTAFGLDPRDRHADQIAALVLVAREDPSLEIMWGRAGIMLAATFMHERTGDEAWADAFRRHAAALWEAMEYHEPASCHVWRQHLYGHTSVLLGAVHGFAGNVLPLIRGWGMLEADSREQWHERITQALRATATRHGTLVNWSQSMGTPRPGRTAMLVQHCHGAPGVINCLADFPTREIDDLLLAAGELTWKAGPLRKGANLCHGTAGNGYALLKLYRRTGDSEWLQRARAFAMHAIAQMEGAERRHGQLRYSLWTGDLGLAFFLWDCLHGTASFPTMDAFFARPPVGGTRPG